MLNKKTILKDALAGFDFADYELVQLTTGTAKILFEYDAAAESGQLFAIDDDGTIWITAKKADAAKFVRGEQMTVISTGQAFTITKKLATVDPLFVKIGVAENE